MLLQNTVDPWSNLCRTPDRIGMFMGNRGILHDAAREIKKQWVGKRWICCSKSFKGIDRRPIFKTEPFSYSELFFLDEATAYAAGHRPCNDCRHSELAAFQELWLETIQADSTEKRILVEDIDSQLHRERVAADRSKLTYRAPLKSLPAGAMFAHAGSAYLVRPTRVRKWTFSGYVDATVHPDQEVDVLTPPSVVALLAHGLPVQVHASADA